ncbi:MAG: XdhC family protein [Planctomycetaceae bacterium]|nr:XdhC family protein [Planctomycetaceae bacterium]
MEALLTKLFETLHAGQPVVYTALVATRGSTPQKPGARMLVFQDGSQFGTLGGGCVEAEVKRQALTLLVEGGKSELLTFDLDKDYGWDDGLICGGRMTMLVDPIQTSSSREFYEKLQENVINGCTEATVIKATRDLEPGTRYLLDASGNCVATTATEPNCPAAVAQDLKDVATRPRPYVGGAGGDVSYVPLLARVPLYIVGAGHVGQKVAEYAASVDFDVTVVDDRDVYCSPERFPTAKQCLVGPIQETLEGIAIEPSAFCIVVTRGHQHDEEALHVLIQKPYTYLGMIGSKRKIKLIFEDLQRLGIPEEKLATVRAPIGLEIGSQTVSEIAISIVAELIAARNLPQ